MTEPSKPSDIVKDAQRIADFGTRSGQITNAEFYEAVKNAAALGDRIQWSDPEMKALGVALGTVIRAVGPDILVGLRSKWEPYKGRQQPVSRWFCLILTFVMILVAAYYTLWHARTTELLKFAHTQFVIDQDEAVRKMMLPLLAATVQTRGAPPDAPAVVSVASPASSSDAPAVEIDTARLSLLLEAMDDVRQLHQSIVRYEQRFESLYLERIMWWEEAKSIYGYLHNYFREQGPWFPELPVSEEHTSKDLVKEQKEFRNTIAKICASGDQAAILQAFSGQNANVEKTADAIVNVETLRKCFSLALGISSLIEDNGYNTKLYKLEHVLTVVNNWLLPALYGALGALVYYMRQFLNPLRPNPGFARVVMRVSLGALAGILIAWFQTTTSSSDAFGITTLGLGSLMIAFIVGFSIDVFFNALERVVRAANTAIEKPAAG